MGAYTLPNGRHLNMDIVRCNYEEYKDALVHIFTQGNYVHLTETYGS